MSTPVDVARLALGLFTMTRPDVLLRLSKAHVHRRERDAVRVLGARYAFQSIVGMTLGATGRRRRVHMVGAAVDAIHAVTMLGLASVSPEHRRLAMLSAITAIGFGALDWREATR